MSKIKTKTYFPGQVIIKENVDVEFAYVINSGYVEVYKKLGDNQVITLTKLGKGQIFGEMSLFGDKKSSATVKAITDVEVQIIDKSFFESQLDQTPPLIHMLLEIMAHRLVKTSDKYLFASKSEAKINKFLKGPDVNKINFNEGKASD